MTARARSLARATMLAMAAFALHRAVATGLGADGRAAVITAAAMAVAFGLGSLRGTDSRWMRWGPAVWAAFVIAATPRLEGWLCGAVVACGEEWRGDVATFALALLASGLPAFAAGAASTSCGISVPRAGAAGAAALLLLDSPLVATELAQLAGWLSPLLAAALSAESTKSEDPPAAGEPRPVFVVYALFGAAAALAAVVARLELRLFLLGSPWDFSQIDALMLAAAAVGATTIEGALRPMRAGAVAILSAAAAGALWLGLRKLSEISLPAAFNAHLQRFGAAGDAAHSIDGPLWAAFLWLTTFAAFSLLAGASARALVETSSRRASAAAFLGAAAGLVGALAICSGGSASADGEAHSYAFVNAAWIAGIALWGAGALGLLLLRKPRGMAEWTSGAGALSISAAASFYYCRPAEIRPASLFLTEPRPQEIHNIRCIRESVDGTAQWVAEPDRRSLGEPVRHERARLDRRGVSPRVDGEAAADASIALAALLQGSPRRALVVGAPTERLVDLCHRAGIGNALFAPSPATLVSVMRGSAVDDSIEPGSDGIRCAAGQRDFDLVIVAPSPGDVRPGSVMRSPARLAALEHALAPQGILAVAIDLESAAVEEIEAAVGWAAARPAASIGFLSDGLLAPTLVVLVGGSGRETVSFTTKPAAALTDLALALPRDSSEWAALVVSASRVKLGNALRSMLPPIAHGREIESLRVRGGVTAARSPAEARALEAAIRLLESAGLPEPGRALANACLHLRAETWSALPSYTPAQQIPVRDALLHAVTAGLKASPQHPLLWRAYEQCASLLQAQSTPSRIESFARGVLAIAPSDWRPRRDLSGALRALLAPDMALELLDGAPSPDAPGPRAEVAVERAECLTALDRRAEALALLREEQKRQPTNPRLVRALITAFMRESAWKEARSWASHLVTIEPGGASHALLESLDERIRQAESRPPVEGPELRK
ncbi:MAG: hypothetical protein JNJ88_02415 [Planctomycetes bacterium]|nr:hypothetical protein [Planctomycetota bacterium]